MNAQPTAEKDPRPVTGPLAELADDLGIATWYTASDGSHIDVSRETILAIIKAMDVDLGSDPDDDTIRAARQRWADRYWRRLLPPVVVTTQGSPKSVLVHVPDGSPVSVYAKLADGGEVPLAQLEHNVPARTVDGVRLGEAAFAVPEDLPLGWHEIIADNDGTSGVCTLAVTPRRLSTADAFVQRPATGIMAQLYSVRSERCWGIGDFTTLADLATIGAQSAGADFILVNPLHAAEPAPPMEDSPYLPSTRRFINPIYLRVEQIPEFSYLDDEDTAQLHELGAKFRAGNRSAELINRNEVYTAKLTALHALHHVPLSPVRAAEFERFKREQGRGLIEYAEWCADMEIAARQEASNEFVEPLSAHENISQLHDELVDFHCWLQWVCDEQLADAQRAATEAGMRIGVMADLAVGVHPGGSDARNLAEWLAPDASVGAPPDDFNQQGQDWSQPPWNPHKLADAAYLPWRDMLRTVLRHSGGIRVDHILGMFRLWWMPRMQSPLNGTYVRYDHEAMVGILALEAELAGAAVIGEDLGTFEPWVQDYLADRGVMGTSILWFESQDDVPKPPENYRRLCLASVTTHDLPPTAGYLAGEHIQLRERLGLLLTDVALEDSRDFAWVCSVLQATADRGYFDGTAAEGYDFANATRDSLPPASVLISGLHRYIAATPAALTCMSLVDMVGDRRTQNQPGTTGDQYPNWRVPLTDSDGAAVLVQDLPTHAQFAAVAAASKRG
ncbi:4-alpha-glucanotransferase [Corynebacterium sp. TAE3-ERU12]|uniref:4-alpha-glucanotransferase n=1 Tax=Corynebacterium sp. TAE3-ERU12 TaxID=2849491 RepID=UPI00351D0F6A